MIDISIGNAVNLGKCFLSQKLKDKSHHEILMQRFRTICEAQTITGRLIPNVCNLG